MDIKIEIKDVGRDVNGVKEFLGGRIDEPARKIDDNAKKNAGRFAEIERRLEERNRRLDVLDEAVQNLAEKPSPGEMPAVALSRTRLRIQTPHGIDAGFNRSIRLIFDEIARMSNGGISIEPAVQSSAEGAVENPAAGMFDCDMTGGAHQFGGDPAIRTVGDIMNGHQTPHRWMSWLHLDGGLENLRGAYAERGMHLVGLWGQIRLAPPRTGPVKSTSGHGDSSSGAKPGGGSGISERTVAEETSGLRSHHVRADFPDFHSMASDHLVCDNAVWDAMPEHHRAILSTAMKAPSFHTALAVERKNAEAAAWLRVRGVDSGWFHCGQWDFEASSTNWNEFAVNPEARAVIADHVGYLALLGLASR